MLLFAFHLQLASFSQMKKLLLSFLLIFSFTLCKVNNTSAQNLVPNPSFEQYNSCPNIGCDINLATGWYSAGYTPDYYNTCASWSSGVPTNSVGYQYPANGNAYAGIATWGGGIREYIAAQLISPLEPGEKYFINFKVSRIDRFAYCANNKIGALFTTVSYSLGNNLCNDVPGLLPNNFAHVYSDQIMTDTANWETVSGSFIADSVYQYIIIGNHFDDSNTNSICLDPIMGAYYLIDDIYVSTDSTTGIEQNNIEQIITVYPSITNDIVVVKINTPSKASIKIYDLLGRLIATQDILPLLNNRISLSEYDVGIYILSVNIGNKIITKKIIVTK